MRYGVVRHFTTKVLTFCLVNMNHYKLVKFLFIVGFVAFTVCHTVAFVIACVGSLVETYKRFFG